MGRPLDRATMLADELIAALDQRATRGRRPLFGNLTWRQLLQRFSRVALAQDDLDVPSSAREEQWLGFDPAPLRAITAAEQRLDLTLPDDYKAFLKISNGFLPTTSVDAFLLPVDEIGFVREMDPELYQILLQEMEFNPELRGDIEHALLISGLRDEQSVFLVPIDNREWNAWFSAAWVPGTIAYPTFRYLIEEQLRQLS